MSVSVQAVQTGSGLRVVARADPSPLTQAFDEAYSAQLASFLGGVGPDLDSRTPMPLTGAEAFMDGIELLAEDGLPTPHDLVRVAGGDGREWVVEWESATWSPSAVSIRTASGSTVVRVG